PAITAAGPSVTVTLAVCVIPTPLIVAETVFGSALVELGVPVATPLPLVPAAGWLRLLPSPVPASATVAPLTGSPAASRAVTVMVVVWPAATVTGAAVTLDWAAETAPAATLKAVLVAGLSPLADATRVYPVPARSTLKFENVATPETAATGPTPDRIAPAGFAPSAIVTPFVALDTRLSNWFRISTSGGGVLTDPDVELPDGTRMTRYVVAADCTFTVVCDV